MTTSARFVLPSRTHHRLRRPLALLTAAVTATGLAVGFSAAPVWAVTANPTPDAGARNGATRLPFSISGTASLSVDVATGNALFTDQLLTLPGRRADVPITLTYNSSAFGSSEPSSVTNSTGSGWLISGFDQRLVANADGSVTYYGPQGLSGVFTASGTTFTSPPQFKASLSGSSAAGYTLTYHASQEKLTFTGAGRLAKDTDRNGNITSYGYDPYGYPSSVVSSRGPTAGRSVTVTTSGGRITQLTQTSGSLTRSVLLQYSTGGHLAAVVDAGGSSTQFLSPSGTDTGQVVQINDPYNTATKLSFTSGKVTTVDQANPAIDGGSGEEFTRLSYTSSTQTLVADPTTSQSQAVSAVPHTTYTLDSSTHLVTGAQDPVGNNRSAGYSPFGDINSTTNAAGGNTTFSYPSTLNGGESLNKIVNPGGATETAGYGNSGATAYLPSSTTDDASSSTYYAYDTNGNQIGTAQASSTGPQAKVAYNGDGTPATSASPGAAVGVVTSYTYANGDGDLTKITFPTNSTLGARTYTWDGFGRLATATDGKGGTISYGYDGMDRITSVTYSDGTHSVAYGYDRNGHVIQRVDGSGTTTNTYDDLGHLLTVKNTANGNLISYTYDLVGALASVTDGLGTTTYHYDNAHELTEMDYPQGGVTLTTLFANSNGRRTDVWLQANSGHTVWSAHEHFGYDGTGRITSVKGENGPATGPTTVENETLCYAAGVSPTSCTGTPATADRSNVQATYESVSGETNTYTYDDHNRLTKDIVTGGANPRTYTYGYDAAGNRTSSSVTGSSPGSQSLTFNDGNQVSTSGYTYDGAGNLTTSPARSATFNAAGQQTSSTVGGVTSMYAYAGTNSDELLSQTITSQQTFSYTYGRPDRNGLPTIDSTTASGIGTGYILSDPSGQPIMLATSGGNTDLYIYDGIRNPVVLSTSYNTTAVALRYDPYGAETRVDSNGGTPPWEESPYAYGQSIRDRHTGEVKFGQRFYSAAIGSWTQQDALNAPLDPGNANRYAYVGDNPVNIHDATGTCGWDSWSDVGDCFSDVATSGWDLYSLEEGHGFDWSGCWKWGVAGAVGGAKSGPEGALIAGVAGCAAGGS